MTDLIGERSDSTIAVASRLGDRDADQIQAQGRPERGSALECRTPPGRIRPGSKAARFNFERDACVREAAVT